VKKLIKALLLVIIVSAVAAAVASVISKKKLSHMTDDEIRAYLASKLEGKVGEDQLGSIQDAVIAGVRRGADVESVAADYVEEVEEAVADLTEVAGDAAEEAADIARDASKEASEVAKKAAADASDVADDVVDAAKAEKGSDKA
jgi:hypothetical protein